MIYAVAAAVIAGLLAYAVTMARKGGADAVRADDAEKSLQEVELANAIRDRMHTDPAYRDRVRDHFK